MEQFLWHPEARVVGPDGTRHGPAGIAARVIPDRPAVAAVQSALAASAEGWPFRIGMGPEPEGFETLTGGTSGAPRRIRRRAASWIASFRVNARLFGIGPGGRVATLGRLMHSLSLYAALEALHLGAELHLLDGLTPRRMRAALAARGVGVLYATPAQLRLLAEAGGSLLPQVRFVLVGGSKLDPALRAALRHVCPAADVREFYGAAEASFITLADADTPEASVGRAYPGVSVVLRDDTGREVPEGQLGQIWVKSPYLAEGYAGPDPGGAIWRDGWLTVGEWGRLEGGFLFLAGRGNRMVTVADQNVFPEEIEAMLMSLPGVAQAAVIPRPDPLRGHVLEAVLIGDAGQEAAVMAALRTTFGPLKAPRKLHWRSDWPVLASGKTDLAAIIKALACPPS